MKERIKTYFVEVSYKFGELIKKYLIIANYELNNEKVVCRGKLFVEAVLSVMHCVISCILLWSVAEADIVVTSLNTMCMFRVLLHCMFHVSMTHSDIINEPHERFNFYHLEMVGVIVAFFVLCVVLIATFSDWSNHNNCTFKVVSSIALLVVCLDDCHDLAVCAYNAKIK